MADKTKISWSDATANVINGCSLASPGCTNCYAMGQAHRFPVRQGLTMHTKGGMVWTGEVKFHEPALIQVLRWSAPRMIFWNAHGDMFHENVPDEWIDRCFAAMALTPHHKHQVLTKRSARMREYFRDHGTLTRIATAMCGFPGGADLSMSLALPLSNVWLGVSVEDQKRADERIPDLLGTPAAVRWLSCEPLLGPVDLTRVQAKYWQFSALDQRPWEPLMGAIGSGPDEPYPILDWIVAGGESGHKARAMNPAWARTLRDQCAAAGVPFHFKQWGTWVTEKQSPQDIVLPGTSMLLHGPKADSYYKVGKKAAGRDLDGVTHDAFPKEMTNAE